MKTMTRYWFTLLFLSTLIAKGQDYDLSISYDRYEEGQYIGYGNIETAFTLTNLGNQNIEAGDTILLAASFNGVLYDMYLKKQDSVTLWILDESLPAGGTLSLNPGYLVGRQWANAAMWRRPDRSLDLCLIVYGVGLASWHNNFADDATPENNTTCITYKNIDLSVRFDAYDNGEITADEVINVNFTITNHGPAAIPAGETIYLRASVNGQLFNMPLTVPDDTTKLVLYEDLGIGESLTVPAGTINGPESTLLLGTDTLQLGILVYGVEKTSVNPAFDADANPANNAAYVTYSPVPARPDLAIAYTNYEEGQYIGHGNIQTAFHLINKGRTPVKAGDTVLLAARFNEVVFDMYLKKQDSVTLWILAEDLGIGDTLLLDPGYLIGWQWANGPQWRNEEGSLNLCLMVYGVGLKSWNEEFTADASPADNKTCITYQNIDLSIRSVNYENNQLLRAARIEHTFEVTNNGPVGLFRGDTIQLDASLNGTQYNIEFTGLFTSTKYVLNEDLPVGGSFVVNPGYLDGWESVKAEARRTKVPDLDSLQTCLSVYGVGNSASVYSQNFQTDGNPANNRVCYTFRMADFSVAFTEYHNEEIITNESVIDKALVLKNLSPSPYFEGEALYLGININDVRYDADLTVRNGYSTIIMPRTLEPGDSLILFENEWMNMTDLSDLLSNEDFDISDFALSVTLFGQDSTKAKTGGILDSKPADNIVTVYFINDMTTGLSDMNHSLTKVYPNPSSGIIHFDLNGASEAGHYHLIISDLTGSAVREQTISGSYNTVNLQGLPAGLYMYTIRDQYGESANGRFVIR